MSKGWHLSMRMLTTRKQEDSIAMYSSAAVAFISRWPYLTELQIVLYQLYNCTLLRCLAWEAASEAHYKSLDNQAVSAGRTTSSSTVPVSPHFIDRIMCEALVTLILEAPVPIPRLYGLSLVLPERGFVPSSHHPGRAKRGASDCASESS